MTQRSSIYLPLTTDNIFFVDGKPYRKLAPGVTGYVAPQPNKNIQRYEHEPPEGEEFKFPLKQNSSIRRAGRGSGGGGGGEKFKVVRKNGKLGGVDPDLISGKKEGLGRREGAQKEKVCFTQRISQKPGAPTTMKVATPRDSGPAGTGKHFISKNGQNKNLSIKNDSVNSNRKNIQIIPRKINAPKKCTSFLLSNKSRKLMNEIKTIRKPIMSHQTTSNVPKPNPPNFSMLNKNIVKVNGYLNSQKNIQPKLNQRIMSDAELKARRAAAIERRNLCIKRKVVLSDDELDDFIEDDMGEGEKWLKELRKMTKYDPSKYKDNREDMALEVGFSCVEAENRKTDRIAQLDEKKELAIENKRVLEKLRKKQKILDERKSKM